MQHKEAKIREKVVRTSACKFNKNNALEMVRCFQELVIARSWRFESSLGHHLSRTFADGMLQVGCKGPLLDLPPCSRQCAAYAQPFEAQGKQTLRDSRVNRRAPKGSLVNNNRPTPP